MTAVETLLAANIEAARRGGVSKAASVDCVIVGSTVMPNASAHPTDSKLLEESLQHLVKVANEHDIALRQNHNCTTQRLNAQIGRYSHAEQFSVCRTDLWVHRWNFGPRDASFDFCSVNTKIFFFVGPGWINLFNESGADCCFCV